MDIRVYIAAHKQFEPPAEAIYYPLQVGSAGTADLGYIRDDVGDQISARNATYCELTGLYWMWKNVECDVIGLCHYRRYFVNDGRILDKEAIEKYMTDYQIILASSSMSEYGSAYEHYATKHYTRDLEQCMTLLAQMYPQYEDACRLALTSNLLNIGNMIITSKKLLDEYCEWLFPLLFELEKQLVLDAYDTYQRRIFGFLAERLLRVWVLNQSYRVKELQIVCTQL